MRFSFLLFIALIIAMACYSCNDRGGRNIDQGEIHYNIDYIGSVGGMPRDILPKSLIVSFKKDKILFEMSTPIGNSGVINLTNPDKGFYDTYLSLFTLRLLYEAKQGEVFPGFESMDSMVLRKTTKTAVICGYNCKNAEVTFPSTNGRVFDIWYTDEIDIKNPNEATPFYSIDGVLLNFFFLMGKTELHFDAETVYSKDIPDALFERRDKFMRVSKENISKFIRKMISL